MKFKLKVPVVEAPARSAWKPADTRAPWEWCEDNIVVDTTSPMPGKWRSDNSPWVKEIMEVFADNRVQTISVMCAAQSSKTQTIMNLLAWAACEDPGPAMWVMAAHDEAKTFCRNRLWPTLTGIAQLKNQLGPNDVTVNEMNLPAMPIVVNGANSKSKLQSKPIRWLFLDEVRNYPKGALDMVLKRTRAFWNARRVIISTPDQANDPTHRNFLAGDQRAYHICCPRCKELQKPTLEQLKAVDPATGIVCKWSDAPGAKVNGKWDFDKLAPNIRYECIAGCGFLWADHPTDRRLFLKDAKWINGNPTAPSHRVSFTWSALLPTWVTWASIVEEFITARAALNFGDAEPLKAFFNETMGEPWEDRLGESADNMKELEARVGKYKLGEKWDEKHRLFMAIDVQADHLWVGVRAANYTGGSRLIYFDKVWTFAEARQKQLDLGVASGDVLIDQSWQPSRVNQACSEYGWRPMRGDKRQSFDTNHGGRKVRRVWSKTRVDVGIGTKAGARRFIPLYVWSNPSVKDMLALLTRGVTSKDWTLPKDTSPEYFKHMTAERRVEVTNAHNEVSYEWKKFRKDDHAHDVECMILVAMLANKFLGVPSEKVRQELAKKDDDTETEGAEVTDFSPDVTEYELKEAA